MLIPPEGWLLLIAFVAYLIGYSMGHESGKASGKAETLEQQYITHNDNDD